MKITEEELDDLKSLDGRYGMSMQITKGTYSTTVIEFHIKQETIDKEAVTVIGKAIKVSVGGGALNVRTGIMGYPPNRLSNFIDDIKHYYWEEISKEEFDKIDEGTIANALAKTGDKFVEMVNKISGAKHKILKFNSNERGL